VGAQICRIDLTSPFAKTGVDVLKKKSCQSHNHDILLPTPT
jgi:hypothetical protein